MGPSSTWSFRSNAAVCGSVCILLVDDDEDFRSGLAENLRDDGHTVYEYAGPGDVPPLTTLDNVSLVVTDYQFRNDDGLRFFDRLHDLRPALPVVMITAYRSQHLDVAAAERPLLHIVRKPLRYEMLHTLVHDLVSARSVDAAQRGTE